MPDTDQVNRLEVSFQDDVTAGANAAAQSLDRVAAALEKAEQRASSSDEVITRVGKSYDTVARQISGAAAETSKTETINRRYEASVQAVNAALDKGRISTQQASQDLDRLSQQRDRDLAKAQQNAQKIEDSFVTPMAKSTDATKLMSRAIQDIGIQLPDVFSQLSSGGSVFRTLSQQGSQVFQQLAVQAGGFKELTGAITGLITPASLAVAGIGAITVAAGAMGVAAETADRQIKDMAATLRGTRTDFDALAKQADQAARSVANTTTASLADAQRAATTNLTVPNFAPTTSQLEALIKVENDFARITGTDLPAAAKTFADAMRDPGKVAQDLYQKQFPGMTAALSDSIRRMADAGDTSQAFSRLLGVMRAQASGAAEEGLTPFQAAMERVRHVFTDTDVTGQSLQQRLGHLVTAGATQGINALAEALDVAKRALSDLLALFDKFSMVANSIEGAIFDALRSMGSDFANLAQAIGGDWGKHLAESIGTAFKATIGMPGSVANIPESVANQIRSYAGSLGYDSSVSDLAQRIAQQESGGRQIDARTGQVLTSSSGALGVMQLMPGTARDLGVNPYNEQENIAGGLAYINQLFAKYHDPALVALAYNWGPGNVDKFLSGVKSTSDIPRESTNYVARVAGVSAFDLSRFQGQGLNAGQPVIDVTASRSGTGLGNADALRTAEDAFQRVGGSASKTAADALANVQALQRGLTALDTSTADGAQKFKEWTDALNNAQLQLANALPPIQLAARTLDEQTASTERQANAYAQSADAGQKMEVQMKAEAQARELARGSVEAYNAALAALLPRQQASAAASKDLALNQKVAANQDELTFLDAEAKSLGMSADARAVYLAGIKAETEARGASDEAAQRYVQSMQQVTAAQQVLAQQQSSVQALAQTFTSAFDTIGNAITQAFVQGAGAAVNWGNILKSVIAQVIQQFLKLAVIQPLINGLFGQSGPTLGGAIAGLSGVGLFGGGGEGGSGGGTGLGSLLSIGSTGSSLYSAAGLLGIAPQGGILGALGLGGGTGGTGLFGGIGSTISGVLGTPAYVPSLGFFPTLGSGSFAGVGAVPSSLGGFTVGGALTGLGVGVGLGSLGGGFIQSSLGKTGPSPLIGAGIGSAIGLIGGPVGAIIGGLIGGLGGGFIGPPKKNPYSYTALTAAPGGLLGVGGSYSQLVDSSPYVQQVNQGSTALNAALQSVGAGISNPFFQTPLGPEYVAFNGSRPLTIGSGDPKLGYQNFDQIVTNLRYRSDNPDINEILTQGSGAAGFPNLQSMQEFFAALKQTQDAFHSWIAEFGTATQKMTGAQQIAQQVAQSYNEQIQAAEALKATGKLSADQTNQLTNAETRLSGERDKAIQDALDAAQNQIILQGGGYDARAAQARAQLSGSSTPSPELLNAQLQAFDLQAQQERTSWEKTLTDFYGDTVKGTEGFVARMGQLEDALGAERLLIQKSYNDQIAAAAKQAALQSQAANDNTYDLAVRRLNASAQNVAINAPNSVEALNAALNANLYAFDIQAQRQRRDLIQGMIDTFGTAYASTQNFYDKIALSDQTLAQERLNIIDQYNAQLRQREQQAQQTAAGILGSFSSFLSGLNGSQLDPRAPDQQFAAAQKDYRSTATRAANGDLASIQGLTAASQSYLQSAQAMYGHGSDYVAAFREVTGNIGAYSQAGSADWLTNVVLQSETRTQTATLVGALQDLGSKLDTINRSLQATNMPARAAA